MWSANGYSPLHSRNLQPLHGVWSSQYKPCLTVGLTRYYVAVSGLVFVDLRIM